MKLHHIGIATQDLEKSIAFIRATIGISNMSECIYDPRQEAYLYMLELEDGSKIELVTGKVVEKIIKKGIYLYHTCYECENIKEEKQKLIKNGAILVSDETEAVLFNNRKVCFLMSQIGMIELLENGYV